MRSGRRCRARSIQDICRRKHIQVSLRIRPRLKGRQQDYFYLIDYVKFKALRLVSIPTSDLDALKSEVQSVGNSYGYAKEWHDTCVSTLGIPESRFTDERSVAELAYANFLQNNARLEDWFNLHVIMIACDYVSLCLRLCCIDRLCLEIACRDGRSWR